MQGEQCSRTPELCSLVRPRELQQNLGRGPHAPRRHSWCPQWMGLSSGCSGLGDGVLAPGAGLSSQGCHYSFWLRDRHGLLPLELSAVGE